MAETGYHSNVLHFSHAVLRKLYVCVLLSLFCHTLQQSKYVHNYKTIHVFYKNKRDFLFTAKPKQVKVQLAEAHARLQEMTN